MQGVVHLGQLDEGCQLAPVFRPFGRHSKQVWHLQHAFPHRVWMVMCVSPHVDELSAMEMGGRGETERLLEGWWPFRLASQRQDKCFE
eukprot:364625-Chlamydomonas_euryale.AAC.2